MISRILEESGHVVKYATNGEEAVNALAVESFDLILMDVQMPELDGLEATRCIRITENLQQPYIIAMTANVLADDRAACHDAGMDDFIPKPVRLDDVREILQRAIDATAGRRAPAHRDGACGSRRALLP